MQSSECRLLPSICGYCRLSDFLSFDNICRPKNWLWCYYLTSSCKAALLLTIITIMRVIIIIASCLDGSC